MAHPKRRQSKTRRDKRRTHYKAVVPQLAKDATTGEFIGGSYTLGGEF